jgi:hypothetical protein
MAGFTRGLEVGVIIGAASGPRDAVIDLLGEGIPAGASARLAEVAIAREDSLPCHV